MTIEIFISGREYLPQRNEFGETLKAFLEESYDSKYHVEMHQNKAAAVEELSHLMQKQAIEEVIEHYVTFDRNFAEKLQVFDVVDCFCLKSLNQMGEVVRELMIDNYQLVLTSRKWIEPDLLRLSFEAVTYGESITFLNNTILRGKYSKTKI